MSGTDHAAMATNFEQCSADNLRRLSRSPGQPVQVAGPLATAAAAQSLLAISHLLADLTDAVRSTGAEQ